LLRQRNINQDLGLAEDRAYPPRPTGNSEAATIFALSSAPGRAGIAVVRLSGPHAATALTALTGSLPPARRARLAPVRDPASGEVIDRGLVLWFPAPRSATGEDVAELHLHGGRAVIAAVLAALGRLPGLRPAEAGEFTRRAFDNDKLDLSEVEGLADLIAAETEAQRRQAWRQFDGALGRQADAWRTALLTALAHLEAAIDFADEDLAPGQGAEGIVIDIKHNILCISSEIQLYLDDQGRGERLRDGLCVAIVGPPNVGKSSLLNALARREAAIVSDSAGTTRDIVEVHLDLDGYPVTLADTAGLRPAPAQAIGQEAVEVEGMRRARALASAADLKVLVLDIRAAADPDALALVDAETLVVLNKRDLVEDDGPDRVAGRPTLAISARTGAGMATLEAALRREVTDRLGTGEGSPVITRARHRRALEECAVALGRAAAAPMAELAAEDLRLALRALGRIAGRVDVEDLLDVIFRDFCIGK
jgi:tRNA modification GTPase